jgi:hypothetical protein
MVTMMFISGYVLFPVFIWYIEKYIDKAYKDGSNLFTAKRTNADHIAIIFIWLLPIINLVLVIFAFIIISHESIVAKGALKRWLNKETRIKRK